MLKVQWQCLSFMELGPESLYRILRLRSEVFVVEQDCVYQDIDNFDQQALHVLGYRDTDLVCYARLLPPGLKYAGASIGRVIIRKGVRGKGLGQILVHRAMEYSEQHWPEVSITLSAQHHLEQFYTSLGFITRSEPYMEDGVPHVEMRRS